MISIYDFPLVQSRSTILGVLALSWLCYSEEVSVAFAAEASANCAAVDIGRDAAVVTSDPKRMQGTVASRTQEFPAKDVSLDADLKPTDSGRYRVPANATDSGCIGLRWYEARLLRCLELHWEDATAAPPPTSVQLQYWTDDPSLPLWHLWKGVSLWQGRWQTLPAKLECSQGVWRWQIADRDLPNGTYRVRWIFPASAQPIIIKNISAYSRSSWTVVDLHAELKSASDGNPVKVVVVNGNLQDPVQQTVASSATWTPSKPLDLKVCYSKPTSYKADRTVLRFELSGTPVSVAVEDVVAHHRVYVSSVGLFVTVKPVQATLTQYLRQIAAKNTVLEQVRKQPDQTFRAGDAQGASFHSRQGPDDGQLGMRQSQIHCCP